MHIPTRTLIAQAQHLGRVRPDQAPRECARRDQIRRIGLALMAHHGTHAINVQSLATAVGITAASLRRYLYDLETLLADLLVAHLQRLYTRLGGFTPSHFLPVRDRVRLPEAERDMLETIRHGIGRHLAGDHPEEDLALLDTTCFDPPRIEAALAPLIAVAPQPASAPPQPKAAPAKISWLRDFPAAENAPFLGDLARISGVNSPAGLALTPTG